MATINVTFTGAQGTLSRTLNLTDAELTRVITAYKTRPGRGSMTNVEVANALVGEFAQMIRTTTKMAEQEEAVKLTVTVPINIG